jgi:hypothetical protein
MRAAAASLCGSQPSPTTLVELPTNQQLADPDVYTFPAVSHQRCRTG